MYISHLNVSCHNMHSFCKPVFSRRFRQVSFLNLAFLCEREYGLILFVFLQHQFTRNVVCACRDVALSCIANARQFFMCVCLFYLMNKRFARFWFCLWEMNFVIVSHSGFGEHGDQCLNLCRNLWAQILWNEQVLDPRHPVRGRKAGQY